MNELERTRYEGRLLLEYYITDVLKDEWENHSNPKAVGKKLDACRKLVAIYGLDLSKKLVKKTNSLDH